QHRPFRRHTDIVSVVQFDHSGFLERKHHGKQAQQHQDQRGTRKTKLGLHTSSLPRCRAMRIEKSPGPLANCTGKNPLKLSRQENYESGTAFPANIALRLLKHPRHLIPELFTIVGWIEHKQPSVQICQEHQAPFFAVRKLASLVNCFIRATSACRILRPCVVSRYALRSRVPSSSSNRSIQPCFSSLCRAP